MFQIIILFVFSVFAENNFSDIYSVYRIFPGSKEQLEILYNLESQPENVSDIFNSIYQ